MTMHLIITGIDQSEMQAVSEKLPLIMKDGDRVTVAYADGRVDDKTLHVYHGPKLTPTFDEW